MLEAARQRRRRSASLSTFLLIAAVLTTALTIAGTTVLMLDLRHSVSTVDATGVSGVLPEDALVVAIGRTPGGPDEWATYAGVFAQMGRDIGRPIAIRYARDRVSSSDMLQSGDADLALMSVNAYLEISEEESVTLVAAPQISGKDFDSAVMLVDADSGIESVEDLRGRRAAFTRDSLAGDAYPRWLFTQQGATAEEFLGEIVYVESQDASLVQVAGGQVDVAAVRHSDLKPWPEGTFTVIARSPEFGAAPVVAGPGISAQLVERMRASLLSYTAAQASKDSEVTGFYLATDADYDFSRVLRGFLSAAGGSEGVSD